MNYSVKSWYDKHTKSWITQIVDKDGNQIGNANYDGDKKSRDFSIKEMNKKIKEFENIN